MPRIAQRLESGAAGDGEALGVTGSFNALNPTQQQDLITFLMSL
jgi:hypothetical protein